MEKLFAYFLSFVQSPHMLGCLADSIVYTWLYKTADFLILNVQCTLNESCVRTTVSNLDELYTQSLIESAEGLFDEHCCHSGTETSTRWSEKWHLTPTSIDPSLRSSRSNHLSPSRFAAPFRRATRLIGRHYNAPVQLER